MSLPINQFKLSNFTKIVVIALFVIFFLLFTNDSFYKLQIHGDFSESDIGIFYKCLKNEEFCKFSSPALHAAISDGPIAIKLFISSLIKHNIDLEAPEDIHGL